ncbi:MAG: peptidylprolyl isomerase [Akkermansiaceae bacterium]
MTFTFPFKNKNISSSLVFVVTFIVAWASVVDSLAAPAAATNLVAIAPVSGEFNLTWEDNAIDEEQYRVEVRIPPATAWSTVTSYLPNTVSSFLTGGAVATTYEFRVLAIAGSDEVPSGIASVTTPDRFTNAEFNNAAPYAHISLGESFSFTPVPNNAASSTGISYTASPLPAGIAINPATGEISGQATEDGYFDVIIEASYTNPVSPAARDRLALRITPALSSPVLETPVPLETLIALQPTTVVPLNSHYVDPDTSVAVQIETTEGNIVFSLFDRAMPEPVTNFLSYVDSNSYSNNIFHRSVNAGTFDIIQSGSYFGDANGITGVATNAPIQNAPGIRNDRGTIAYARTTNPNSATSGWYINTEDSPGLDVGDSYAVFGRATTASLSIIDTIFNYTTGTYSIPLGGNPFSFEGFPTTDSNAPSASPNNLIIVNQIIRVPVLSYTLNSNSSPAIASASIIDSGTGPELQITPLLPGQTTIGYTVADIDGNNLAATHDITVQSSYASWLAGLVSPLSPAGPSDNSAGGTFNNLQSYAFGGDANDPSDDRVRSPSPGVTNNPYDFCFYHRKFASDLTYTVQYSYNLDQWDPVWTTDDGITAGSVIDSQSEGDFWKLTVRKTLPQPPEKIFLRVVVTLTDAGD